MLFGWRGELEGLGLYLTIRCIRADKPLSPNILIKLLSLDFRLESKGLGELREVVGLQEQKFGFARALSVAWTQGTNATQRRAIQDVQRIEGVWLLHDFFDTPGRQKAAVDQP